MSPLLKVQSAGFKVSLKDGGTITVAPASELTDEQRAFIRSHKPEILAELKAKNSKEPEFKQFVVTCNGKSNVVILPTGLSLLEMRNKFCKSTVEILH